MIKKMTSLPAAAIARVRRVFRPRMQVRLTRKNLLVYIPVATARGLHVIPRAGLQGIVHFSVSNDNGLHLLQMHEASGKQLTLASFERQGDADDALKRLNAALGSNVFVRWAVRLLVLWLVWIVMSAMSGPTKAVASNTDSDAAFVVPPAPQAQLYPSLTPTPAQTPAQAASPSPSLAPTALQSLPSGNDLSEQIYAKAMEAQAQAQQKNMPPRVVDNTDGLNAFGLDAGGSSAGPGCNPKLAFTVPEQAPVK